MGVKVRDSVVECGGKAERDAALVGCWDDSKVKSWAHWRPCSKSGVAATAVQDAMHDAMIPEVREAFLECASLLAIYRSQEDEMSARFPHELLCANDNMNCYNPGGSPRRRP
jgi:hypothetical protein